MHLKMYSVYDKTASYYNPPFFARNDEEAKRTLEAVVNDNKTTLGQHPMDFHLSLVGTFDDNTGLIKTEPTPVPVIDCIKLKAVQQ